MDLDGPRKSESTSMDIDGDALPCRHPQRCDSVEMNSSGLPSHPFPGSDIPSHLSSSSSSANHLGQTGDVYGLARQRRDILPSLQLSIPGVTSRKRKHTHDSQHTDHDHTRDDDSFADAANSHSSRRIRPRLRDREFTPLLIMSPSRERDSLMEEETISAFHYPPNVTDSSRSIRPCSHLGNLHEHGPRMLQSSSLPTDDDTEGYPERRRSDSANSLAQVALASTTTSKHGRLSTLSDFSLPRPFDDDAEQPLSALSRTVVKVHERGIDAAPSFSSTKGGRTGGLRASRERAGSPPADTLGLPIRAPVHGDSASSPRLEPSSTNFFGKPICDSPDPIDSDEDGLTRR